MVNEEKVRLMTRAASYEAGAGRKALKVNRYFRGDYLSLQLIRAWIAYTVAFALCLALWVIYKAEYLMDHINQLNIPAMGKGLGLLYLSLLGVFLIINYLVYRFKYQDISEELTAYNHILKKLAHIYQTESHGAGEDTVEGVYDDDLTGV